VQGSLFRLVLNKFDIGGVAELINDLGISTVSETLTLPKLGYGDRL
jgi:hypothetical protein